MKDYVKDTNGRVTNCDYNVSQMNVLEHLKHFHKIKNTLGVLIITRDEWLSLFTVILRILIILTFPIYLPIMVCINSKVHINRSKSNMKRWDRF